MSVYTYQEAYQHFAQLWEEAKNDTVMVTNQNGEMFSIQFVATVPSRSEKPNLTRAEIVSYVSQCSPDGTEWNLGMG
jgi:hypothetical protein